MKEALPFGQTPHPVIRALTEEEILSLGPVASREAITMREKIIAEEAEDPYSKGYILPHWKKVDELLATPGIDEVIILGGNRAAKSRYAGRKVVETLLSGPRKRVWAFNQSAPNSIEMAQPIVYEYLPPAVKGMKSTSVANVKYSVKNGFSDGTFVLPNGSACVFRNYSQDPKLIEGGEVDLAWCDELVPMNVLNTLRMRIVTRGGKIVVTFTPIEGWSPTVKEYLSGAKVLETRYADLLGEEVPTLIQPVRKNARVVYFWTQDNPWSGWENMKRSLESAQKADIKCRAYGIPTKAISNLFAGFDENVNVVPASSIPKEGTRYMAIDPAGARLWFAIWALVDAKGHVYIYRECPDQERYFPGFGVPGAWAIPSGLKADGEKGPAQAGVSFNIQTYVDHYRELEGDEVIMERYIDPRFASAPAFGLGREETRTLLDDLNDAEFPCNPAPAEKIELGVSIINTMLSYDKTRPLDVLNCPKLYISEECKNLAFALQEFTGQDGKVGAMKDSVDCLRYLLMSGPQFCEDGILRPTKPLSY